MHSERYWIPYSFINERLELVCHHRWNRQYTIISSCITRRIQAEKYKRQILIVQLIRRVSLSQVL